MEDVMENPDIPWDYDSVCRNPNLTIEFIVHMGWGLNINELSKHPVITMEHVDALPDLPWLPIGLVCNPNFTMAAAKSRPDIDPKEILRHRCNFHVDRRRYIHGRMRYLSLLSLMDEDYGREEGVLDRNCAIDLVFQNEYIVSRMCAYV